MLQKRTESLKVVFSLSLFFIDKLGGENSATNEQTAAITEVSCGYEKKKLVAICEILTKLALRPLMAGNSVDERCTTRRNNWMQLLEYYSNTQNNMQYLDTDMWPFIECNLYIYL